MLFGLETEYALGTVNAGGAPVGRMQIVAALIAQAQKSYPHLPDETLRGVYLPNSARCYPEAGDHVEYATPECETPWDVVRHTLAGHRIVAALARAVDRRRRGARTTVFRTNVDVTSGASFGSHESLGYDSAPTVMAAEIAPHLASRVIYTGSGGFRAGCAGIEFMLSPRAAHILRDASSESTRDRGLIHTKDEALGGAAHRLHLICGDTTCSELSGWLRAGTTALIVAIIDAGDRPGSALGLARPVEALHAFASDPDCSATARTVGGADLTALAIQRHYLTAVEARLSWVRLPTWASAVCARWRAVLDDLASRSPRVATSLDWAIKLPLLQQWSEQRGIAWAAWPVWTGILTNLRNTWARLPGRTGVFNADVILDPGGPLAADVARLTPALHQARLQWQELPHVLAVRDQLHEIDLRFGQLDDDGIFNRLDALGLLTHHVDGIDGIDEAMREPPAVARAQRRAQLIRELAGTPERYSCTWTSVMDYQERRYVDLGDPSPGPNWQPIRPGTLHELALLQRP